MTPALLHLSDTHFGTEQAPVVAALERLVREQAPQLAVLSGDITQRATRAQFAAARAFVDRLGIARWAVIPGNHDIPLYNLAARLFNPYGRYQAAFGENLAPVVETDDWLVLTHKTTRRWRHENGQLSDAQIAATAERLRRSVQEHPGRLRLVVVHQPVAVPLRADPKDVIKGARKAVAQWAAAGADIVLGGHIHLACVLPLDTGGAPNGRMWAVQAGTAVSSRVRGGTANSVNLLRPARGDGQRGCSVERWDFDGASGRFLLGATEQLVLRSAD